MSPKSEKQFDLLGTLDESLMDEGQIDMANFLKRAENDPVLQQRLADYLEREYGTVTSESSNGIQVWQKGYDKPEGIVKYFREALALGVLKNIPKEKLN